MWEEETFALQFELVLGMDKSLRTVGQDPEIRTEFPNTAPDTTKPAENQIRPASAPNTAGPPYPCAYSNI